MLTWASVSGLFSVVLFFLIRLSRNVLASTQQQTHGNSVKQSVMWWGRTKEVCEFKGNTKFSVFLFFVQFLYLFLPHCHSLFKSLNTPLPPLLPSLPPSLWLDPLCAELIQSDRTAEPVGACVCGCLRASVHPCKCVNVRLGISQGYESPLSSPSLCLLYAAHLFW